MLLCGRIMSLEILDTAAQGHGDRGPEKGSCGLKRSFLSFVRVRLMPEASSMNTCFFQAHADFLHVFDEEAKTWSRPECRCDMSVTCGNVGLRGGMAKQNRRC